jgi:hypothetical protein
MKSVPCGQVTLMLIWYPTCSMTNISNTTHFVLVSQDQLVRWVGASHTIPTLSFPMSVVEGESFLVSMEPAHRHTAWTKRPQTWHTRSAADAKTHLAQLTARIDQLVKQCGGDKKGCFVKLSCRSAKVCRRNLLLRLSLDSMLANSLAGRGAIRR